jgi:hypothetical protein
MFVLLWHNVDKKRSPLQMSTSINVFKVPALAEKSMYFCLLIYFFFSLILSEDVCSAVAVPGDDVVFHLLHPLCPGRHTQMLWRDHQLDTQLPPCSYILLYNIFHFFTVHT